jgi:hypothetical protein
VPKLLNPRATLGVAGFRGHIPKEEIAMETVATGTQNGSLGPTVDSVCASNFIHFPHQLLENRDDNKIYSMEPISQPFAPSNIMRKKNPKCYELCT